MAADTDMATAMAAKRHSFRVTPARVGGALACLAALPFVWSVSWTEHSGLPRGLVGTWNGHALARLAVRQIETDAQGRSFSIPADAAKRARRAFALEPLAEDAHFVLAGAAFAAGRADDGNAILESSLTIDKGHRLTGLLALQQAAQAEDLEATFRQLDRLIAIDPDLGRVTVQALSAALSDPQSMELIRAELARRPRWADAFWNAGPDSDENFARFMALRFAHKGPVPRSADERMVRQLLERGAYERAFALADRAGARFEDGGFANASEFAPLGWDLTRTGALAARLSGQRLLLSAQAGAEGIVARQLLKITGRPLQIVPEVTGSPEGIELTLRCAASDAIIARNDKARPLIWRPGTCKHAWLEVGYSAWDSSRERRTELVITTRLQAR